MSPASYLTAPPRVAAVDCTTVPRFSSLDRADARTGSRCLRRRSPSPASRWRLRTRGWRHLGARLLDAVRPPDGRLDEVSAAGERAERRALSLRRARSGTAIARPLAACSLCAAPRRAVGAAGVDPRPRAAEVTASRRSTSARTRRASSSPIVDGDRVDEVVRRTRITKLGEGVDARRILLPVPIARVRNVLGEYRREAEELGAERILAVATSAVRDAENGEAFLGEVEWSYGFATRLLSGDEEAALTLRGVGPLEPGTVVIDVGGGSTELITDGFRTSLDVGSVRLTERFGADRARRRRTSAPPPPRAHGHAGARRRRHDRRARRPGRPRSRRSTRCWRGSTRPDDGAARPPRRARPERGARGGRRRPPRDARPPRRRARSSRRRATC